MLYSGSGWGDGCSRRRAGAQGAENQELKTGVTYVWWIDLHVASEIVFSVVRLLSPEERNRAHRIADSTAYREFVLTRSAVRFLLASHVGCAPEELSLVTGPYGKPAIAAAKIDIEFNVAHSRGLALMCLSRDRHVGVDLERIHDMADLDLMGTLTLTTSERSAISTAAEPLETFFRCWVRKEAVLKAAGVGLSASLCDVDVTTSEGPTAVRLIDAQARWTQYEVICLDAPPGYKAAIACERSIGDLVVKTWRWN
jgi:4'-phosphopantetheinyl transferase